MLENIISDIRAPFTIVLREYGGIPTTPVGIIS
jgi:hypothetical protein